MRRALAHGDRGWRTVVLVQTVAGPLAGDRTEVEIEVGEGAALELRHERGDARLPRRRPGAPRGARTGSSRAPGSRGGRSR